MIRERAPAKVNLVLHVGSPAANGLHEVCSLFAALDLADEVDVEKSDADAVICEGVEGPNLAARAIEAFRSEVPRLPPLRVTIHKRIPVAAGLGGGSADAAAVLRAANELTGAPLDAATLRRIAAGLGSDVPSQVEPRAAIVTGTGEHVEPVDLRDQLTLVLVPQAEGLSTAEVFAELDRGGGGRDHLDPAALRELAAAPLETLAAAMENDLQAPALRLRPDLAQVLEALTASGALAAQVSGSGPTCFGLFPAGAEIAQIEGAVMARTCTT